ncbi:hypothetical protein [Methylotenera versatilis]|uniref:Uncharacterized protein n=1 Tax=Methylotenera versatilis (strain 301) TaxID=666681 RepID=D7DL96_METV0|nr:hypothetical protein [Methylotenera versatilis]ADI30567.1 hypothetical protein M301_2200 [Methylotenera versatilis 301]
MLKPNKELAIKAAINLTPQYADLLRDIQSGNGRAFFSAEIAGIRKNLGDYVLVYDNENKIGCALFLAIMGEDRFKEFTAEINNSAPSEQQEFINEMASPDSEFVEAFSSFDIPQTANDWKVAKEAANNLPEEERKELAKRGATFWCFLFSSFFNTLALMVHGSRMTTLVPQAIAGDDVAFLKAIQIDRMLLSNYPYFRDRKVRAQDEGDTEFLKQIAYRETNPPLRGKVQFPALYMLFGILDTFLILSDLKHREILDICDDAGLDRYQNRIEDIGYLGKRLRDYRDWQKINGMSTP